MFEFRFQSILQYRKTLEEQIQSDFAEQKRRIDVRVEALSILRSERVLQIKTLRAMERNRVSVSDLSFLSSYIRSLREKELKEEKIISELKVSLEEKRSELVDAMRKRKIMEALREKHFSEFQESEKKLENKELDEIAVTRFRVRDL